MKLYFALREDGDALVFSFNYYRLFELVNPVDENTPRDWFLWDNAIKEMVVPDGSTKESLELQGEEWVGE